MKTGCPLSPKTSRHLEKRPSKTIKVLPGAGFFFFFTAFLWEKKKKKASKIKLVVVAIFQSAENNCHLGYNVSFRVPLQASGSISSRKTGDLHEFNHLSADMFPLSKDFY